MTFWILMLLAIALQAAGQVLQKHRVAIRVPGVTLGSVLRRPLAFFGPPFFRLVRFGLTSGPRRGAAAPETVAATSPS